MDYNIPGLPDQIESTSFEYYQHKPGTYIGIVGELVGHYKNPDGKKCQPDEPGAKLSHLSLRIYLQKYLGTPQEPTNEEILGDLLMLQKDSQSPTGYQQAGKFYYAAYVSLRPKDQWKNVKTFTNWIVGKDPATRIIQQNPKNPATKVVVFKNFPLYYGAPIQFDLIKGDKGGLFFQDSKILDAKWIQPDEVKRVSEEIAELIDKERQLAKASQENEFLPPEPGTSLDDVLGDYADN